MEEIWKDIPGWEGIYQVSNLARIRCIRVTYFEGDKFGDYIRVTLSDKKRRERHPLHRLVAQSFLPNTEPEKYMVNHKDGNKKNNKLENLEWVTPSENIIHAFKMGLHVPSKGSKLNKGVLKEEDIPKILELCKEGKSLTTIAKMFNTSYSNISIIKNNKAWKHIERK